MLWTPPGVTNAGNVGAGAREGKGERAGIHTRGERMQANEKPAAGPAKKRPKPSRPMCGWFVYLRSGWKNGVNEWRRRYDRYMLSPEWKKKRAGVFARAGNVCAVCKQPSKRLQAHHVDYRRAGKERPEDLRAVCKPCHETIHAMPTSRQPFIPMDAETRRLARDYREACQKNAAQPAQPKVRRRPKPTQ